MYTSDAHGRTRGSGPKPSVMPSIFDEVSDGDLNFAWSACRGATNSESESHRRMALSAFFDVFNDTYQNWMPVEYDEANGRVELDVGCRMGHPLAVVETAIEDARGLVERLPMAFSLSMDKDEREMRHMNVGVETMRAMEIMARSRSNRVAMEELGAMKNLGKKEYFLGKSRQGNMLLSFVFSLIWFRPRGR